jgi:hypothetical protein
LLVSGTNVFAAEIHQSSGGSSDIIFDLGSAGEAWPLNQAPSAAEQFIAQDAQGWRRAESADPVRMASGASRTLPPNAK